MNIFFTSAEHRTRWLSAILSLGRVFGGKLDQEYGAALYVLTSSVATWEKAEPYIDREGIDFEGLLAEVDFSGGYRPLIRLAWHLFNSGAAISPLDLYSLDESNFEVAMCAIRIRRVPLPIDDLASKAELYNIEIDTRNRIIAESREKPWLPLHDGE